jgi:hypothetical protein
VSLLHLATLGVVALLTWFEVDPSGPPALLPAAATIIGGSCICRSSKASRMTVRACAD